MHKCERNHRNTQTQIHPICFIFFICICLNVKLKKYSTRVGKVGGYSGFGGYAPCEPALLSHKKRNQFVNSFGYNRLHIARTEVI